MTSITFTLKPTGSRRTPQAPPHPKPVTAPRRGDRGARMLALAYAVETAIEAGTFTDFSDAGAALGITRARMAQIAALTLLAPDIQARLLAGDHHIHERDLRAALRFVDWNDQQAALQGHRIEATN